MKSKEMKSQDKIYNFDTLCIHAGQQPDIDTKSIGVPVHRTCSYIYDSVQQSADVFSLKELGNIYTRITNPTQEILEKRIADLEGACDALALSSGTAAIYYSIINFCSVGEEIISSNKISSATQAIFNSMLPQFGINVKYFNPDDPSNLKKAITKNTRGVFIETISNPTLDFMDIDAIADIAHSYNIPLIVDATFTTPYLLKTIEYGADIVINSLSKWIGGHGTGIGGAVADSGKFDWKDPKFKLFNEPDPSYNGIRYAHDFSQLNSSPFIMRMRHVPLRNIGACISPDNAWIFLQGLETLHLRMERHCENSFKAAEFLRNHPKVNWIRYPGLNDDPTYEVAKRYLKRGFGSVVVLGLKGGNASGERFVNSLKLFSLAAGVGDVKSLALQYPFNTTHLKLTEQQRKEAGEGNTLVRLSIGIEDINDILSDLNQALRDT
uniref:O-acetylhomoserine sulfhydrylase n=1 Tax=Candidatus Kentrum sp. FW TaxID=2126338 RepID=A0A450TT68_9GAMM|nr:MAG: O-acetylhomoserine sulfhydrylase [Candidatus Kentron sp. FW]